jgi:hypothetical protein
MLYWYLFKNINRKRNFLLNYILPSCDHLVVAAGSHYLVSIESYRPVSTVEGEGDIRKIFPTFHLQKWVKVTLN